MFRDKITSVGRIKSVGKFSLPNKVFYVFLSPKGDATESVAIIAGMPVYNKAEEDCPLVVGAWNPVLFKTLSPTREQIDKYNIFWGTEDYR